MFFAAAFAATPQARPGWHGATWHSPLFLRATVFVFDTARSAPINGFLLPAPENAHYWLIIQPLISAPYNLQMGQAHAAHYRDAIQDCSCIHFGGKKEKKMFLIFRDNKNTLIPQITTAILEIVP